MAIKWWKRDVSLYLRSIIQIIQYLFSKISLGYKRYCMELALWLFQSSMETGSSRKKKTLLINFRLCKWKEIHWVTTMKWKQTTSNYRAQAMQPPILLFFYKYLQGIYQMSPSNQQNNHKTTKFYLIIWLKSMKTSWVMNNLSKI